MAVTLSYFHINSLAKKAEVSKDALQDLYVAAHLDTTSLGIWDINTELLYSPLGGGRGSDIGVEPSGMTVVYSSSVNIGALDAESLPSLGVDISFVAIPKSYTENIGTYRIRLKATPQAGTSGYFIFESFYWFVVDVNGADTLNTITDSEKEALDAGLYSSSGTSGTSGTSGVTGAAGTSGTSGVDGVDGTSGTSGTFSTSGFGDVINSYMYTQVQSLAQTLAVQLSGDASSVTDILTALDSMIISCGNISTLLSALMQLVYAYGSISNAVSGTLNIGSRNIAGVAKLGTGQYRVEFLNAYNASIFAVANCIGTPSNGIASTHLVDSTHIDVFIINDDGFTFQDDLWSLIVVGY